MRRCSLPRTYRATLDAWIGQLVLPAAFFTLLTITAVNHTGLNPWLGGLGLSVLALIAGYQYLLPMLHSWVRIDERSIEGQVNGRYFYLYWTEIAAAWMFDQFYRQYLCLGTRDVTLVIPLRFLDQAEIWDWVSALASPEALTAEAMTRLPDYQRWSARRALLAGKAALELDDDGDNSAADAPRAEKPRLENTVADHWLIQVVGWSVLTFAMLWALEAVEAGHYAQAGLLALLLLPGVLLLLGWGLTEFTPVSVERYTLFGRWQMRWDAVRRIEISSLGASMVLIGDDCQLAIPGPVLWTGTCRHKARSMLLAQAEKRGIPIERTPWATFKFSRRFRMPK